MDLFAKIVYCLKSLTTLTRSTILRSITRCWNILCLLKMLLNATLWHIFVEHQVHVTFIGVFVKHCFAIVPMTSPMGRSSQIFVHNLLWRHHFYFLLFYCSSHCEKLLNVINEIEQLYFLHIFYFIADFKQVFTMF